MGKIFLKVISATFFFFLLLFYSCNSGYQWNHSRGDSLQSIVSNSHPNIPAKSVPVKMKWYNQSDDFKNLIPDFRVDSAGEFLLFSFSHAPANAFQFPTVDSTGNVGKIKLTQTRFYIQLFSDGKIIPAPYAHYNATQTFPFHDGEYYSDGGKFHVDSIFQLKSCFENLNESGFVQFKIPYYAFAYLPIGMHEIKMVFYQDTFESMPRFQRQIISIPKKCISAEASFSIFVPPVYRSQVTFDSLKFVHPELLTNSDHGITYKQQLPDVYWNLNCPKEFYQLKTPTFSNILEQKDEVTLNFLHLALSDTIDIDVEDNDYLSGDDFLGDLQIPISSIPIGNEKSFQSINIKQFLLRRVKTEIVNDNSMLIRQNLP